VPDGIGESLRAAGQHALADRLERLAGPARERLAARCAELDLRVLPGLVRDLVLSEPPPPRGVPGPGEVIRLPGEATAEARERGEEALRAGRVACVLLAGGQGTRLGFSGPKGDFPIAPVSGRTLFALLAAQVGALRRRYGAPLPWFVMTSPQNDEETRAIFARDAMYGLGSDGVRFFAQGTMPAVDRRTGDVLLEAPDRLALSPDGHGGLLRALARHGILRELAGSGVTTLFTFQVDNPLAHVADPVFVGHHLEGRADMSNVVVTKVGPEERMGVVATLDGRPAVIEYSDLPDELARARDAEGRLVYWAGSIAIHLIQVDFATRLTDGELRLPVHRALKRVRHLDPGDVPVMPDEPNAVKFETFLFDALPLADRVVTIEADRGEWFSPVKNADGPDSPRTTRRDMARRAARWLAGAGVRVPAGPDGEPVPVEIEPALALDADELAVRLAPGVSVAGPAVLGPDLAG
jgi:UDP-N-acetylglucosamine/UDP-N-acetylgalactosamine diphosphorylase